MLAAKGRYGVQFTPNAAFLNSVAPGQQLRRQGIPCPTRPASSVAISDPIEAGLLKYKHQGNHASST
jgi:hypothetical protein